MVNLIIKALIKKKLAGIYDIVNVISIIFKYK
jgi:hypothetical protein